ncbi:hypothetical protein SADUNF_Sadunf14G0101000 [Salix dunnii]|uniref:Uncharacterized protein n=1 Tax=Salix dunnii TaxID=1413687 RepID=A0A835JJ78_9ROSI|nr:hypothetical protein SADUNF_Sadunf14G0101000 [Salix dunnii]
MGDPPHIVSYNNIFSPFAHHSLLYTHLSKLITALASQIHVKLSTISAAPAFLPDAPLSSPPALSPDIQPLFPSPGVEAPSPTESSLPTIPSSPSPPNPGDILAPGPERFPISPSGVFRQKRVPVNALLFLEPFYFFLQLRHFSIVPGANFNMFQSIIDKGSSTSDTAESSVSYVSEWLSLVGFISMLINFSGRCLVENGDPSVARRRFPESDLS